MATSWCPQCRSEYRDGFSECADCGVALVDELPSKSEPRRKVTQPTWPALGDDVELVNVSAVEAELIASQLRAAGIPAGVQGIGTAGDLVGVQFVEGSTVMVRRTDLAAARAVLEDLSSTEPAAALSEDESLAAQAEAAAGWSDPETGAVV